MSRFYTVLMTDAAAEDLPLIYDYIAGQDGIFRADDVLDRFLTLIDDLSAFSESGNYPKELIGLGIQDYRQIFVYTYRLIYRIVEQEVIIYLVVDGRGDLNSVLAQRLLAR
ncbi:type II toxin-antitoxin system RelE/ParE family toxin [Acinetobacter populi]|uniref:Plasmid stabilization protein n=1 Tax=Acinetobacter populi TaxID=1582270 RepID=A0A1Z9Z1Y8_9GAMM|nr:type II toxin-antitoxin system RelE/ParE family toxin [Acinetobacter populi]OUY08446.1 plasmid stabilization protein [Acinetobacter populi]